MPHQRKNIRIKSTILIINDRAHTQLAPALERPTTRHTRSPGKRISHRLLPSVPAHQYTQPRRRTANALPTSSSPPAHRRANASIDSSRKPRQPRLVPKANDIERITTGMARGVYYSHRPNPIIPAGTVLFRDQSETAGSCCVHLPRCKE
jgi:hypothetical protein